MVHVRVSRNPGRLGPKARRGAIPPAADALSLFDLTKPTIDGQGRSGDVVCTESCGRVGMTFRRGTCCLVYKTSGREKCGGCPLRTDEDRAGVYAERMSLRSEQFLV